MRPSIASSSLGSGSLPHTTKKRKGAAGGNNNSRSSFSTTTVLFVAVLFVSVALLVITNLRYSWKGHGAESVLEVSLYYYSGGGGDGVGTSSGSKTTTAIRKKNSRPKGDKNLVEQTIIQSEEEEEEGGRLLIIPQIKESTTKAAENPPKLETQTQNTVVAAVNNTKAGLTCGCPNTCDERAHRYSNGHYRCDNRVKFLMERYFIGEEEACTAASAAEAYAGNPPCDSRCTPGVCKVPQKEEAETVSASATTAIVANNGDGSGKCGCPATCNDKALKYQNGHNECGPRIEFLKEQYQVSEVEACAKATEGENPSCDTRCKPGVCQISPEVEKMENQKIDCGCPETCDAEGLAYTNGHHICGNRIEYLINRYHTDQISACKTASEGQNPPCDTSCKPGVCTKPPKVEKPPEPEFHVDCGCPDTCDDLAQDYTNGHFNCGHRLQYLMTKHHVTEEEACRQSTEGENPPCDTSCKAGVCKAPEPPLNPLQLAELNVTAYDPNAPPKTSMVPWANLTTLSSYTPHLYSGFRNQMAVFTILMLESIRRGTGQFLIESIRMKDTFGSNRFVNFYELWDVEHWNSYYPLLPRLVMHDPILHDQFDLGVRGPPRDKEGKWMFKNGTHIPENVEASRPAYWGAHQLVLAGFMRYTKGKGPFLGPRRGANPADILMQKGALRLHPDLQAIMDSLMRTMKNDDGTPLEYMTVHARVEPDMQRHGVCRDMKVLNLTDIFRFMEEKWPEPPAKAVFMPIARELLEEEGYPNKEHPEKTNWIAVENLRVLDDALENGLWGGRVKVFRFGANVMKGTKYEDRPSISGSMIAYFIALNCKIFVGTQVSSYSHALVTTRYHRKEMENYEYLPDGLHRWTPTGMRLPPPFEC